MSFSPSPSRQEDSFHSKNKKAVHQLLLLFVVLLCCAIECCGSTTAAAWARPEEDKSQRHPLHWLQQQFPNVFGNKDDANKAKTPHHGHAWSQSTQHPDLTKRRRLYYDALQRHAEQTWTITDMSHNHNATATAHAMYARLSRDAFPPFPPSMRQSALEKIRHMFYHAYDGYFWNAWPHGELLPGACRGTNFSLIKLPALTAIDTADTFWLLGNTTELVRITERLRQLQDSLGTSLWDINENISVFETTIRILGGLLSAHQILVGEHKIWRHDVWDPATGQVLDGRNVAEQQHHYHDDPSSASCPAPPPLVCTDGWPGCLDGRITTYTKTSCDATNTSRRSATAATYEYDGFLLQLATDIADRMLPAFDTATGIPYGTVNLQTGVPPGETPVASLAGGGTLILEWELLSRLTRNPKYGKAARLAARALWMRQSKSLLVGKHIDTRNGAWVETLSGIGSNSDSFIEYLVKYCFVFLDGKGADDDFRSLWPAMYQGVHKHMRRGDWYADTDCQAPSPGRAVFESLMAFYPGLQSFLGEIGPATRSLNAFFLVREHLGFLPERFSFNHWKADGPTYPLRPELFESNYFMHRAVENFAVSSPFSNQSSHSGWLWAASWSIDKLAQLQTSCGYASLSRLSPESTGAIGEDSSEWKAEDDMPSFFLSETLKYLYLTFDEDNPLHTDDNRQWMFTTEAHPIHLPVRDSDKEFLDDLSRLEGILTHRIQHKAINRSPGLMAADRWAPETSFKDFLSGLWPIELEMKRQQINRPHGTFFFDDREVIEPRASSATLQRDDWSEVEGYKNLAHLQFSVSGVGAGYSLRSACPNYHASDLLWIHALRGDTLDFTEGFVTAKDDHAREKISKSGIVYGSAEALGLLGMKYNLGHRDDIHGCRLGALAPAKKSGNAQNKKTDQNYDEVSLESELGNFQITAFKDGTGFSVTRAEDGRIMTASFLHSVDDNQQGVVYFMLRSERRMAKQIETKLSVADFAGKAFDCTVSLKRVPSDADSHAEGDVGEEILRVPCTPAMFGPAHMTNLVESHGATISAQINLPPTSDMTGCEEVSNETEGDSWVPEESLDDGQRESSQCPNVNIQVVNRGICSFMTKAVHQKEGRAAEGMIVINTDDELFTMAGDPESDSLDRDATPLSVMVSRQAGQAILSGIREHSDANSRVLGRIMLEAHPIPSELENSSPEERSATQFPIVHATKSLIQIYAENNWGIQAIAANDNWSLQLVKHSLG